MCRPYTYRIKFLPTGQEYYGARYGKRANPDTFWLTYFTSSKIIKDLISKHGAGAFETVEILEHGTGDDARKHEELFLVSSNAADDKHWLNRHNGGKNFCVTPESVRKTIKGQKDFYDNNPEELQKRARNLKKFYDDNPEFKKAHGEKMKRISNTPEEKAARSERGKRQYQENPEIRRAQGKKTKQFYIDNPEARARASRQSRERAESEEYRKSCSERSKIMWQDPEFRSKQVASAKKQLESAEARQAHSDRLKVVWRNNPSLCEASRVRRTNKMANAEAREVVSQSIKDYYKNNPQARVKKGVETATTWAKRQNRPFSYLPGYAPKKNK